MNEPKNQAMQALELQMGLDNLKTMLPLIIDHVVLNATIRKAKFDALINEGFTEQQALHIVANTLPVE